MSRKEFYSVKEVAQILSLSPDRIYEYLRTGHLRGARLTEQSAWRIPDAELQRLAGLGSEKSMRSRNLNLANGQNTSG